MLVVTRSYDGKQPITLVKDKETGQAIAAITEVRIELSATGRDKLHLTIDQQFEVGLDFLDNKLN